MNEEKLLQAISALLGKELGDVRQEIKGLRTDMNDLRTEMNERFDAMQKEIDALTLSTGDIVTQVGEMLDDKLGKLSHELQWTQKATAQNSLDIAALKMKN